MINHFVRCSGLVRGLRLSRLCSRLYVYLAHLSLTSNSIRKNVTCSLYFLFVVCSCHLVESAGESYFWCAPFFFFWFLLCARMQISHFCCLLISGLFPSCDLLIDWTLNCLPKIRSWFLSSVSMES